MNKSTLPSGAPVTPIQTTARSLPIALLRAREIVMVPIRQMLAKSGINEQKWRVLRILDETGPMEQTAIAQSACLLLSSLTRMLQAMEAEGLLTRQTDPADRRKSIVSLTEAGRDVVLVHAEENQALMQRLEQQYGADRLRQLLDLLEELQALPD